MDEDERDRGWTEGNGVDEEPLRLPTPPRVTRSRPRERGFMRSSPTSIGSGMRDDQERGRSGRDRCSNGEPVSHARAPSAAFPGAQAVPRILGGNLTMPEFYRPKLSFMIVGAQKCGTTALAYFLSQHPEIGMASPSEAHMFDSPQYSRDWSPEQIDERYRPYFSHCTGAAIRGESTPMYMFLPDIAPELKRYNPDLKLIVLLRDPVERAISHYYMEKARDREHLPLWMAVLSEPFRTSRSGDPREFDSVLRVFSYRRRGLYGLQLRNLYRYFGKGMVLVICNRDLLQRHDAVLRRVFNFLGVSAHVRIAREIVRKGGGGDRSHLVVSCLLRLSYLVEFVRLRVLLRARSKSHCPALVE